MLEQQRRQGASAFIYVLFTMLIAGMVYSLAPSGHDGGCRSSGNGAPIVVDGQDANQTSYMIAFTANGATGKQKTYVALEWLIRRELLAQAAVAAGIHTTGDLVDEAIKKGWFFLGGQRIDFTHQFLTEVDGEKFFNFKNYKAWVSSLNVSLGAYREEQTRGMQAALMADIIRSSSRVSRDEALADYLYEHDTATYDVVEFDPAHYRAVMRLADADIKRFLETHGPEVEARYKADERTYKGVKPQVQVREIFIPKAYPQLQPKPDDAKKDDAKKDAAAAKKDDAAKKAAENPRGLPIAEAKAKLEALRAQIAAGKLAFVDAEKQVAADSSDDAPNDNGDRGWFTADAISIAGDKDINDAVKALKPGEVTPVVATDRGVYLATIVAKREGDLTYDQVKTELAALLAKDAWSKEAAKRAALEAQAEAQKGNALDKMFEREVQQPPGGGLEQLLNSPDMTPEQRQQIQQLIEQQRKLPKHGSLETREVDIPVGWYAEADGSSSGAGSAAPAPAAPAPTAPAPTAAGSAATTAAGAGSAAAPADAPATAAAPAVIEASKDQLPAFGNVAKPHVNRFGPTPREPKLPGIGGAKPVISALFTQLKPGEVGRTVYEGDNGRFVVVQLINRETPKVEEFDKIADAEIARMQAARGKAALGQWLKDRCETLAKAGKIRPSRDRIRETDDKGNDVPTTYRPCMYFDMLDR